MKKVKQLFMPLFFMVPVMVFAQEDQGEAEPQNNPVNYSMQSIAEKAHFIANMRGVGKSLFREGEFREGKFAMEEFRLEFRSMITDRLSFRYRDRYTSRNKDPQKADQIAYSIDLAEIKLKLDSKWTLSVGKLGADWGGYEYDLNPIDIYQYSDYLDYGNAFLLGAGITYNFVPKNTFTLQVLNAQNKTFAELYPKDAKLQNTAYTHPIKFPFMAVFNWRGKFLSDKLQTSCSYSFIDEAYNRHIHQIDLGVQADITPEFQWRADYGISIQGLDRNGLATQLTSSVNEIEKLQTLRNVNYSRIWTQLQYRISPMFNAFFVGFWDNVIWKGANEFYGSGSKNLKNTYGFYPGIELYPIKNFDLRFYLTYIGRFDEYSKFAKEELFVEKSEGYRGKNDGRIVIGFVTPLTFL